MKQRHVGMWVGRINARVEPPVPENTPPPPDTGELQRLQFEADQARAASSRLQKELEEIKKQLPSDEQRARWAELDAQYQTSEEQRKRKEGEFDAWRVSIQDKHTKELDAARQERANEVARAEATERELNDTLIGLAFSNATEWFGPTGKTVLTPAMAQAYFAPHVSIEVVPGANGSPSRRRVIVKDARGVTIVDSKTGQPPSFGQAIGEVIESHPDKKQMLRGSGKVGSNSPGGESGIEGRDLSRLKPSDFQNQEVRDAVRESLTAPGGLKVGPGFDLIERQRRNRPAK